MIKQWLSILNVELKQRPWHGIASFCSRNIFIGLWSVPFFKGFRWERNFKLLESYYPPLSMQETDRTKAPGFKQGYVKGIQGYRNQQKTGMFLSSELWNTMKGRQNIHWNQSLFPASVPYKKKGPKPSGEFLHSDLWITENEPVLLNPPWVF